MLCEISSLLGDSFLGIYFAANCIMFMSIVISSSTFFYHLYWPSNVTFEKWQYKSNPTFPPPEKVRDEVVQTLKGMLCVCICPSISIYLAQRESPLTQAFCGWGGYSLEYHVASVIIALVASDFFEFAYHRLGHVEYRLWDYHKHHHVFHNPSPFAVIADEWVDQFFRSTPLLFIPMLMPINIDMLFIMYGIVFYFYGVYLHSGYEWEGLSAHNKIINTSFQHYCHHAKSTMNKPYHCGFFVKLWDNLFQCVYPEDQCFCAECSRKNGERTREAFEKIHIPDYSRLFGAKIWMEALPATIRKGLLMS